MKKTVIYNLISILLVSCTSEFPVTPDRNDQEQGIPVHFTFTISPEENTVSRALNESSYLVDGDKVGIFALKGIIETNSETGEETFTGTGPGQYTWDKTNIQTNFFNEEYEAFTYKEINHQLEPVSGITGKFPSGNNAALQFYAYYPYTTNENVLYNAASPAVPKIPVVIGENIEETIDYLYTGPVATRANADENVQLTFHHALACLKIYIQAEKVLPPALSHTLTEITITTQWPQSGWMNLENGNITFNTQATNNKFYAKNLSTMITYHTDKQETPCCSFMLLPDPDTIDNAYYGELFSLELTTKDSQNNTYKFTLNWEALKDIQLRKGKTTNLYINYNFPN